MVHRIIWIVEERDGECWKWKIVFSARKSSFAYVNSVSVSEFG